MFSQLQTLIGGPDLEEELRPSYVATVIHKFPYIRAVWNDPRRQTMILVVK